MTVTIHALATPAETAELTRHLVALAGGDKAAVRSGNGGLVVDDALALAYLSRPGPTSLPRQGRRVPPDLAVVVREAEGRSGLLEPRDDQAAAEQAPPQQQPKPARRPRRKPVGAAS